jgi:hypothetical protein
MGRIVLTDASPIIYLAQLEHGLSWLEEIYREVAVTPVVRRELLPKKEAAGKSGIEEAFRRGVLREIEMKWTTPKFARLDDGEESTIRAAINLLRAGNSCLILIDDKEARQVLQTLRPDALEVSGTVAVIGRAKERGIIKSAALELEKLRRLGFRVSDDIVRAILHGVGESSERWPPGRRRTATRKARH